MSVGEGSRGSGATGVEKQRNDESSSDGKTPDRQSTPIADIEAGLRGLDSADEDLAELLANNWQRAVGILVIALVIVWMFNEYQGASLTRQYAASESFASVQSAYQSLAGANAASSEEQELQGNEKELLEENLQVLRSSHEDLLLSKFAELYHAQQLILQAKFEEADKVLAPFLSGAETAKTKTSAEAIVGDVASLIAARSLLIQEKGEEAQRLLYSIFQRGGVASVESAVLLASLVEGSEEREQLIAAAKNVTASYPLLAEDVRAELSKVGIDLEA